MLDKRIEVSVVAGLTDPVSMACSVFLPEASKLQDPPVAIFLYPGGGYSRGYFYVEQEGYSQADFHVDNGYVVIACDHLGTGDSDLPDSPLLSYEVVAEANAQVANEVLDQLRKGTLSPGVQPMEDIVAVGAGQSMGGCILTVQQALHQTFAGVAMLGWSGIHTVVPAPPDTDPFPQPLIKRNDPVSLEDKPGHDAGSQLAPLLSWAFYWNDEPRQFVEADLGHGFPSRGNHVPMWASATFPLPVSSSCSSAGCVAAEAATIDVPILIAVGQRDVCPDPWREPQAYSASTDISLFMLPRSAHMHNFADTREHLWDRLEAWIQVSVATPRRRGMPRALASSFNR